MGMDKSFIGLIVLTAVLVWLQAPQLMMMMGIILGVSIVTVKLFWLPWKQ
jgi:hypothetical protein